MAERVIWPGDTRGSEALMAGFLMGRSASQLAFQAAERVTFDHSWQGPVPCSTQRCTHHTHPGYMPPTRHTMPPERHVVTGPGRHVPRVGMVGTPLGTAAVHKGRNSAETAINPLQRGARERPLFRVFPVLLSVAGFWPFHHCFPPHFRLDARILSNLS